MLLCCSPSAGVPRGSDLLWPPSGPLEGFVPWLGGGVGWISPGSCPQQPGFRRGGFWVGGCGDSGLYGGLWALCQGPRRVPGGQSSVAVGCECAGGSEHAEGFLLPCPPCESWDSSPSGAWWAQHPGPSWVSGPTDLNRRNISDSSV